MIPFDDASVDALDIRTRNRLSRRWEERIRSELEVGLAFADLAQRLCEVNADAKVLQMTREAAEQERRHAEICHRLAERYGARTVSMPALERVAPRFGYDDERLEVLFEIAGMCCVNESIAAVWLRRCAELAETPLARTVNQLHLREEVMHARLGWAHLASSAVDAAMRRELGGRLDGVIAVNVAQWVAEEKHLGEGVPEHGYPSVADTRALVAHTVRTIVRPGFAHVGVML